MEDRTASELSAPEARGQLAALERDLTELRALLSAYIHDRETAEEALRESEARYHALVQRAAFGVYRATPDGRYLDANPALVAMLGYSSEAELKAIDIADAVYVDPADRQRVLDQLTGPAAERGGEPMWMDVHWRRRDGRPIRVRLSARMVRDAEGEPAYIEGIAEDVTERARNDELLRRSERMASLGHTLAGVAHEINNPLAAVGGFAQLLLRGAHDWDEDDRSALETIAHEAARAGKIVRDLLTFARRQEDPRHTRVMLNDVVRYILAAQRYALATHGVRHEVTLAPGLPPVLADAAQIEQVVLNLVVNARQALESDSLPSSSGEPRLTVRTSQDGAWVVLEVADNGPGISADDRQRIFDPFFTTKGEGEGTGLGLSVVHGIVASHGGSIDLESTLGAGTRFLVRLPASSPASATTALATDAERDGAGPATHALDVLLVDSDAATVGFLTRYLSSRGHAVVSAADGAGALRLAEQGAFDVIVCDLGTDGGLDDATAATLRSRATAGGGRFITTMTAAASGGAAAGQDADAARARSSTAATPAHVLQKPYDVEALRRAVEERA